MKIVKWIGIVFGGLIGALALAAGVFYVGWLRGPSPEEVCAHLAELGEHQHAAAMEACVRDLQPPRFGKMNYVRQMKCLLDAETRQQISECTTEGERS